MAPGTTQMLQVMSWAQHMGDLILPSPLGHFETSTVLPSSLTSVSCTSSAPHVAQVMFTLIPHLSHVYVAIELVSGRIGFAM